MEPDGKFMVNVLTEEEKEYIVSRAEQEYPDRFISFDGDVLYVAPEWDLSQEEDANIQRHPNP